MDPGKVATTRTLRRKERILTHTQSHIKFIHTCLESNITPKGFRVVWTPAYQQNYAEKEQLPKQLDETSQQLMKQTIQHLKTKQIRIEKEIQGIWKDLEKVLPTTCKDILRKDIEKEKKKTSNKLQQVKTRKLSELMTQKYPEIQNLNRDMSTAATPTPTPTPTQTTAEVSDHYDDIGEELSKLKIIPVIGDGNCLFRALSFLLYNTENDHFKVRTDVVNYMDTHRSRYEVYIDTEFHQHIHTMRRQR